MPEIVFTGLERFERIERLSMGFFARRVPELAAEVLMEDARLRLEDDVSSPTGRRWEAWSDDYAKTRSPSDKLLHSSGDMAGSFKVRSRGNKSEITTDSPYAHVHQFGSRKLKIKARPYMGAGKEAKAALSDVLAAEFDRMTR